MKRYDIYEDILGEFCRDEGDEGEWVRYADAMEEINRLKQRILNLELPRRRLITKESENYNYTHNRIVNEMGKKIAKK